MLRPCADLCAALLGAAARLQVTITRCVLVGDSGTDVAAARAAGCPVICVPYGYNHGQDIRTSQPDSLIESLAELPELLDQHFSAAAAGAKPDGLRWRH